MPKNKIDIKDLNIPNVCFSLTDKDDKREKKYKKQRIERGFDDSETWSLDITIAQFVLPRLKRLKEIRKKTFCEQEEYVKEVNKMIKAFELIGKEKGIYPNKKDAEIIEAGLESFKNNFHRLWV